MSEVFLVMDHSDYSSVEAVFTTEQKANDHITKWKLKQHSVAPFRLDEAESKKIKQWRCDFWIHRSSDVLEDSPTFEAIPYADLRSQESIDFCAEYLLTQGGVVVNALGRTEQSCLSNARSTC